MSKLSKYINDEIKEISKYNTERGEDCSFEWVKLYAAQFRKKWEERYGKVVESGVCSKGGAR